MNNTFQEEKWFNLQLQGKCTCQNRLSWFAGRGKGKLDHFFLGHIVEYLKPATKAPHKLEVKTPKSPFTSHASLKGKEQFALHPSWAALVKEGDCNYKGRFQDFRLAPFEGASLLLQCGFPGAG